MNTQKATFGGGCFWGVEATFRRREGVISTAVGYLGGTLEKPSYQDVCTGQTGHAAVVDERSCIGIELITRAIPRWQVNWGGTIGLYDHPLCHIRATALWSR